VVPSLKLSSKSSLNFLSSTFGGNNSLRDFATPLRFVLVLMGRYMEFSGNGSFNSSHLSDPDIFTVSVAPSASLTLKYEEKCLRYEYLCYDYDVISKNSPHNIHLSSAFIIYLPSESS